jgi:photosynthetic reaction center H subunit
MQSGAYLDVAQVTLYVFWIFFACLIYYLRREDKREGYPLDSTALGGGVVHGFPRMPDPKSYLLSSGHIATLPNHKNDRRDVAVAPIARWPGAPVEPTGNPMLDGVGPGSWADREDVPELNIDKIPCIVPLRVAEGTFLESRDPDPRGMLVIGADREIAGVVTDVWVDRAEALIRYLEVEVGATGAAAPSATVVAVTPVVVTPPSGVPVPGAVVEVATATAAPQAAGPKRVLLPMPFAKIDGRRGRVRVSAILGGQFADVPVTASPVQVTKLEEDRIVGYYGAGTLYATPARQEPLL